MDSNRTIKKRNTYFKNYDLYSDANPKDTIRMKYATLDDVKNYIKKLENIYKTGKKPHTRISKNTNVLVQRLRVIDPKGKRFKLATRYFDFLKERTKIKNEEKRKKLSFKLT